jgi:long-chain acyl-CoA synthetase
MLEMDGAQGLETGTGDLTVPALLMRSVEVYGGRPAIGFAGEPALAYDEVGRQVGALAERLTGCGIRKGDSVAILGENSPQWVLAYLATTSLGVVAVPILPGFPGADARHIIRDSEAIAVFVSESQRSKLEDAEMPRVRYILSLENFEAERVATHGGGLIDKAKGLLGRWASLEAESSESARARQVPSPDDPAVIIYTSGTTGHSKGVVLTHRNIVSDVAGSIQKFPIDCRDRFLSVLPLSHTFEATGGLLCPLAIGASVSYIKGLPTPKRLLSAAQTVRPTGMLAVPLIMDKIYRARVLRMIKAKRLGGLCRFPILRKIISRLAGRRLVSALGGCLRFVMLGGAALNEDLERFLQDAGIVYSTGYGMTEASPILTISPFGRTRIGSCGQPIPCVEIRILEPDHATGVGEIIVRGPNVMKGYYRNEQATRDVLLEGGWLRTGDMGRIDRDGYLYIKGRSKNVIVGASGENVYPEIIEHMILRNPYVQQAIVYQRDGRLIARAYLDQDVIDQELERCHRGSHDAEAFTRELLEQIRVEVNRDLPAFSAVQQLMEQPEPFELTPTNKVKRYLYVD